HIFSYAKMQYEFSDHHEGFSSPWGIRNYPARIPISGPVNGTVVEKFAVYELVC
ncbi:hypothetical protein U1Q18_051870, partial [Sarracenia purpurea var. burkii]